MLCIYLYHIYTPLLNGYNLSFHLFSKGCSRCPTWIFLEARPHQPRGVLDVPTWIAGGLQLTSHSKKDTKRPQRSQRSLSWRCQWCQWLFLLNFPSEWVSKKVHRRHSELFLGYGWPCWINFIQTTKNWKKCNLRFPRHMGESGGPPFSVFQRSRCWSWLSNLATSKDGCDQWCAWQNRGP